jgi:putative ABC transport system ATP-binding protein
MVLQLKGLTKQYRHNGSTISALDGISIDIQEGEFVTITGPSGSGKSTLLFTVGGLVRPSSGSILFKDQPLQNASDDVLSEFRKRHVGYIMQNYFLIPYLTAEDNVMVALSLTINDKNKQRIRARELLETVGLPDRMGHYPKELSSGQQQRVAIARALANSPAIILADEPTGNLDPALASEILTLLKKLNTDSGVTIVMVTHSPEAANYGTIRIHLKDGRIT